MNGRIFRRRKNPMIFQLRDRLILDKVFQYRFLDPEQVAGLCGFNSRKRANDRLRKMFDAGHLSRRLLLDNSGRKVLCFPGPKAAEILASASSRDPSEIRKKRMKVLKVRDSFLSHFVLVNWFHYSLEVALKCCPLAAIEDWSYKKVLFMSDERRLYPDAYMRFRHDGEVRNCFLEVDRSIESRQRIRKKIEFYLDYGLSGDFENRFGPGHFRLLIVCKTMERLKSLSKIVQSVTDKSFCWLTVSRNVSPGRILNRIWRRSNKEGEYSLIE